MGHWSPNIAMCSFVLFGKIAKFHTPTPPKKTPSLERRGCFEWLLHYWSTIKTSSAQRAFFRWEDASGLLQVRQRWEKGQSCFSMQIKTGACFLYLSGVYFASRKLQVSCFVSFVWLLSQAYCPSVVMCCFAPFGKRATFPSKSILSRKANMFAVGFRLMKPTAYT